MTKVITYQAPNGETINVTRQQKIDMAVAGVWPRNGRGEEYCSVSHGLHVGEPTFADITDEIERAGGEWFFSKEDFRRALNEEITNS